MQKYIQPPSAKNKQFENKFYIPDNDDCVYSMVLLPYFVLLSLRACALCLEIKQKHIELAELAVATLQL